MSIARHRSGLDKYAYGKDYTVHSALSTFVKNEDYHVKKAYVLFNAREITTNGRITYLPIYDVMFLDAAEN